MTRFATVFLFLILLSFHGVSLGAVCLNGIWDVSAIWPKDCTPGNEYDGRFMDAGSSGPTATVDGKVPLNINGLKRTLSWRLHYWKNRFSDSRRSDSLPLLLVLHSWSDGVKVDQLLDQESSKMQYEGSWEDVVVLSVAIENGNDDNTWWWGYKIGGTPTPWAENAILDLLKARKADACKLLAAKGASRLADKRIDSNRVYLYGQSMGGTGTYHMGLKHPEIFAAVHAVAGFSDFLGPCGNFCDWFDRGMVGSVSERLKTVGLDRSQYPARQYTDMRWFVADHKGASWERAFGGGKKYEPPYVFMTHGKIDEAVNIASADRLWAVLKASRFGGGYYRHSGAHSGYGYIRWQALANFRLNQSFLAFTNNSTDAKTGEESHNFLNAIGWLPGSIVDETDRYRVELYGAGTVDITLRRLQNFKVSPGKLFTYWLGPRSGPGHPVSADAAGVLTIPKVAVKGKMVLTIGANGSGK